MTDHDWAYDVEDRAQAGQVPRRLLEPESSLQRFAAAISGPPLIVQHGLGKQ